MSEREQVRKPVRERDTAPEGEAPAATKQGEKIKADLDVYWRKLRAGEFPRYF